MSNPFTADSVRPGVLPWTLGDRVVVALNDGHLVASLGLVQGIPVRRGGASRSRVSARRAPRITVNAFLILGGPAPVLVDAGMGAGGPATLGHLPKALAACGVAPEAIGTVLVTHLHSDHIGGLMGPDGAALYPNAEVVIPEAEAAYWLADGAEGAAPEGRRRASAAPTRSSGLRRPDPPGGEGEVLPGIEAILAPGHTPGHTAYRVQSGETSLLIWGDVVHLPAIQFARQGDPVLRRGRRDGGRHAQAHPRPGGGRPLLVAGMHLEFPALGRVRRDGAGFAWVPEQWSAAS